MTDLYDATEVNASLPKPADKVWAKYIGSKYYGEIDGPWHEVEDAIDGYGFKKDGILRRWDGWPRCGSYLRHVGPTPPDDKAQPMQALADLGQQFDADGWITHDGSEKRPKGVGKRDMVEFSWDSPYGEKVISDLAREVAWANVTSYRVIDRAEKRRKIWAVESEGLFEAFDAKSDAAFRAKDVEGTLYTAKLKKVK